MGHGLSHGHRFALVLLCALAACSSTIDRRRMRADLAASAPAPDAVPAEDVGGPAADLRLPFVLAVAPPLAQRRQEQAWGMTTETATATRSWTREEREAIEAWEPELVRLGVVSDLVVMPVLSTSLAGRGVTGLDALRAAARQHRADAVLIVSEVEDSSTWLNPWSILDLTIVGAWFAPGHNVEVVTVLEAVLLDVAAGRLHASGQGEGDVRERRAWAYADDPQLSLEARTEALAELGQDLMERARGLAPQGVR